MTGDRVMTTTLRPIAPLDLPLLVPGGETSGLPRFIHVPPQSLLVDESYQRNLSRHSVRLITRIVKEWSWRAFKPPVVVEADGALHVIDGQHSAIAAAMHPGIDAIPVMIIEADRRQDRADAFVRHNRDRIQVSGTQLHYALVAAGDEDAMTVQQVCDRAGARILKYKFPAQDYAPGDTMAIVGLNALVTRRYAAGARRILDVCVQGRLGPIGANHLKAVEALLFEPEYRGSLVDCDIATTIREFGPRLDREAARYAAEHDLPVWRGMIVVIFRHTKKVRRGSREAA